MTEEMQTPTKEELIAYMQDEHAKLEEIFNSLTEAQFHQENFVDQWRVKDILPHIRAWEQRMMFLIKTGLKGETPDLLYGKDTDKYNKNIYLENKDTPLKELRQAYEASYQETLAFLQEVPSEKLFTPKVVPWDERPLWGLVVGNTGGHYEEHRESLEAALKNYREK